MTSRIEIDVTELEAFYQRVHQAGDAIAEITLNEGLRKVGKLIVPATGTGPLADETPKRSGKLAKTTVFQILGGPGRQVLEIRQAAKSELGVYYGFIVREGRGPVFAREGGFLHFFINGQEFFRKSVGPLDKADVLENQATIEDALLHVSSIFPNDSNLTCTLTAGQPADTWGAWAEIADSGANTLSALFASVDGHISSLIVEEVSEVDTVYMVEFSYGAAKTVVVRTRFAGGTKFQAPNVQNRMWTTIFAAGETVYYRMKTATAVADTAKVHVRYHLH
jgi:hypothetical protein